MTEQKCPECKGTGFYVGFNKVEPCSKGCQPPVKEEKDKEIPDDEIFAGFWTEFGGIY